jgi:hypothetical protein
MEDTVGAGSWIKRWDYAPSKGRGRQPPRQQLQEDPEEHGSHRLRQEDLLSWG